MPLYNKYPRLPAEYYLGRRIYFVTICSAERRPIFTEPSIGRGTLDKRSLASVAPSAFVHLFKQLTGYKYRQAYNRQLWQTRFYDHIVRSADDLNAMLCYVWMNPVRKGLCAEPSLYPLSGSQTVEWMKKSITGSSWLPPWKKPQPG